MSLVKRYIIVLCCIVSLPMLAQEEQQEPKPVPTHYMGLYGEVGYNNYMLNAKGIRNIGGPMGGLGLAYKLDYGAFRFNIGAQADYAQNFNTGAFNVTRHVIIPTEDMTFVYRFKNMAETQRAIDVSVPIMLGAKYNGFFFMIGTKLSLPVWSTYTINTDVDRVIYDEPVIDYYTDMPNHYLYADNVSGKGDLKLRFIPKLAFEIGYDLDPWLAYHPKRKSNRKRKKTFKELLHYEISALLNVGLRDYRPTPEKNFFEADNGAVSDLQSTAGAKEMASASLTPIEAGVKFSIYYEFDKPQKKKNNKKHTGTTKKTTTTKTNTKPKPIPVIPDTIPVQDTIPVITYEGRELTTGDTVILKNVYFASDKWDVLPWSQPELEKLYTFLTKYENVTIQIVGHTDNTNTEEYNQVLSERRANSVRNEMIKRGIDPSRMIPIGRGELQPIDTNLTPEGKQNNRRVEFVIQKIEK